MHESHWIEEDPFPSQYPILVVGNRGHGEEVIVAANKYDLDGLRIYFSMDVSSFYIPICKMYKNIHAKYSVYGRPDPLTNGAEKMEDFEDLIERQFTYHSPSPNQVEDMKKIRDDAKALALEMYDRCSLSSDLETAIQKLREAVMFANASIVLDKEKNQ